MGRASARIWGCVTALVALLGGGCAFGSVFVLTTALMDTHTQPIPEDDLVAVVVCGLFGAGLCLLMGLTAVRIFFPDKIGPRVKRWSGLSFYFASFVFLLLGLGVTIALFVVDDVAWRHATGAAWMYLLSFAAFKLGKKYRSSGD